MKRWWGNYIERKEPASEEVGSSCAKVGHTVEHISAWAICKFQKIGSSDRFIYWLCWFCMLLRDITQLRMSLELRTRCPDIQIPNMELPALWRSSGFRKLPFGGRCTDPAQPPSLFLCPSSWLWIPSHLEHGMIQNNVAAKKIVAQSQSPESICAKNKNH